MYIYLLIISMLIIIRYARNRVESEFLCVCAAGILLMYYWGNYVGLTLVPIAIILINKINSYKYKSIFLLILALLWYSESKYHSLSYLFNYETSTIQLIGTSYILIRILHYIYTNHSLSIVSSLNYLFFPPAILIGPIQNIKDYQNAYQSRVPLSKTSPLFGRMIWGAFKIFILSSFIAPYALDFDNVAIFEASIQLNIFISLCAYTLYLYCNFSGAIDIAIPVAKIMGWHLPENFNWPLLASNIKDFWRCWHITLGNSIKDLLFKPLVKKFHYEKNTPYYIFISCIGFIIVFAASALWHNFSINYLLWGLWHANGMILHTLYNRTTLFFKLTKNKAYRLLMIPATFSFVSIGWLFFIYPQPSILYKAVYYNSFHVQEVVLPSPYSNAILINYKAIPNSYVNVLINHGKGFESYQMNRDGKYNFVHIHGDGLNRSLANGNYDIRLEFYNQKNKLLYTYNKNIEVTNEQK